MKKHPIEIFSDWVTSGKDDGMEINHLESVTDMLDYSLKDLENFNFIDAGCGTGWVVRMVSKMNLCNSACGLSLVGRWSTWGQVTLTKWQYSVAALPINQ
jgi:hypothetical protein